MPFGPPPPPPKKRTGLWIGLAAGGAFLALVLAGGVFLWAGPFSGGEESGGNSPAESARGGEEEDEGSGQEEAAEPDVGDPPHALPDDPCAALTSAQRSELDAQGDEEAAEEGMTGCSWSVLVDGSIGGHLDVVYLEPFPDSGGGEAGAEEVFDFNVEYAVESEDGTREVSVEREQPLDLGDESLLVHAIEEFNGDGEEFSAVSALIRQDDMNIRVVLLTPDDLTAPQDADTLDDLMTDLGREAINNIG
ncbi:DUF3558 domain-containing protein [Allosalinactinospora lopnorensis]|uniref:hypothetical protein n=1 Tax=Allosalinactinospora lopnorensis TaxID=1352348 RepID=UPI000623F4C3|nr:hypothetical protein [Allosalinactinospora lopnorensis]